EVYMQEWRQEGPLGVLIDVINHIKTPQQHEIFRSFQTAANAELPARERLHVLEPVKPVVTRWNSYYAAFKRATCERSVGTVFQLPSPDAIYSQDEER
ncbi:hypothetical protein TUN205_12197, partial [Pyrenophora tritici-repentis]